MMMMSNNNNSTWYTPPSKQCTHLHVLALCWVTFSSNIKRAVTRATRTANHWYLQQEQHNTSVSVIAITIPINDTARSHTTINQGHNNDNDATSDHPLQHWYVALVSVHMVDAQQVIQESREHHHHGRDGAVVGGILYHQPSIVAGCE